MRRNTTETTPGARRTRARTSAPDTPALRRYSLSSPSSNGRRAVVSLGDQGGEVIDSTVPAGGVPFAGARRRELRVPNQEIGASPVRRQGDGHLRADAGMFVRRLDVPREHDPYRWLDGAVHARDDHRGTVGHEIDESVCAADAKIELE